MPGMARQMSGLLERWKKPSSKAFTEFFLISIFDSISGGSPESPLFCDSKYYFEL
jgi:hypothetical protein